MTELHRVKIISAELSTYWYANQVGSEFIVTYAPISAFGDFNYAVIHVGKHTSQPLPAYINGKDVELLETFDGRIVEQLDISVEIK